MSDRSAVVLAVAVVVGAAVSWALPLWPAVAVGAAGFALRRPWLVCLAGALVASALGARAWAGLDPVEEGSYAGTVTLVAEPEDVAGAVRVDVAADGRRLEAWARGGDAGRLRDRMAGERVSVVGRLEPPPEDDTWMALRHVVGRLSVTSVGGWERGHPVATLANGLRRTLLDGARPLPDDLRSIFAGLVLGDVREQSVALADEFRGAGLSHLLAVSGQNVAFVLALAAPLAARCPAGVRPFLLLAVLGFFALVTRFEPSVLRASAMAAIATVAVTFGSRASSARLLSLAVATVVLVDPLLVWSAAFRLSVAASAGIIAFSQRIARALPGPRPLAGAASVTLAAQLGVAPVLIPTFGGLPVASLPANLAVAPVAGPVTLWGLTAGVVAGLLPDLAGLLHAPTRLLVGWIAAVARTASSAPLGELGMAHLVVGVSLVAIAWAAARWGWRRCSRASLVGAAAILLLPAIGLAGPQSLRATPAPGATLWRAASGGGAVLVVDDAPSPSRLLVGLRRSGVRRLDLVVLTAGGSSHAAALRAVSDRYQPALVLAPEGHRVPGAQVPAPGTRLLVGGLTIVFEAVGERLEVAVTRTSQVPP